MTGNNLKLGLDLDGVITETPEFFSAWTHSWPGEVVIITYRKDRQKAVQDLADRNIRYDELVLVDRFEAKAEVIANLGVHSILMTNPKCSRRFLPVLTSCCFGTKETMTLRTNSGCSAVGQVSLSAIECSL